MLTVEELKKLEIGDWIWLKLLKGKINGGTEFYLRKFGNHDEKFLSYQIGIAQLLYSDYGQTWLAYKNKEEVELGRIDKRTAQVILQELYNRCYIPYQDNNGNIWQTKAFLDDTDIKELADKYDIEVGDKWQENG